MLNDFKSQFEKGKTGKDQLYIISLLDSIDRIDMLLLEIRHVQLNIIYNLKEPCLYAALKYEEDYIWLSDFKDYFFNEGHFNDENAAIAHIPLFPPFRNKVTKENSEHVTGKPLPEDLKNLQEQLAEALLEVRKKNKWSDIQSTSYHSLVGLQLLKRDLFQDKLSICHHAKVARLHRASYRPAKKGMSTQRAQFMIVRGAILHRIATERVDRLHEYKLQLGQYVDLSSDGMPQSSVQRRREIELYSNFLNERSRTMRTDYILLIHELLGKDCNIVPAIEDFLILHNWNHGHKSQSKSYKINYKDTLPKKSVHISTHLWMPERPDLQPIIAHEMAHVFIRSIYDDFKLYKVQSLNDSFSILIKDMRYIFEEYKSKHAYLRTLNTGSLIKEISCDFLAASLKDYSYLFAHFVEYTGVHYSFKDPVMTGDGESLNTLLIKNAKITLTGSLYDNRDWYLRSLVLVKWIESTSSDSQLNYLHKDLITGIKDINFEMMQFYLDNSATPQDKRHAELWVELTQDICNVFNNYSKPCRIVKKWKKNRSQSEYCTKGMKGNRKFPKRSKKLDFNLRNHLYIMQLWMKFQKDRPFDQLHDEKLVENDSKPLTGDEVRYTFNEFYLGEKIEQKIVSSTKNNPQPCNGPLYKYIYDIPWQSALMRAKDLHWKLDSNRKLAGSNIKFSQFLYNLADQFPIGRDLFSYALEFHLFDTNSAFYRFKLIKNQLHLLGDDEVSMELKKIFKNPAAKKIMGDFNKNRTQISINREELFRKDERKIGEVLKNSYQYLHKNIDYLLSDKKLLLIYNTLSVRNTDYGSNNSTSHYSDNLYDVILKSFTLRNINNDISKITKSNNIPLYKSYLVGKIAISRFKNFPSNSGGENNKLHWKHNRNSNGCGNNQGNRVERYHQRLGRHDVLMISSTSSLCRCPLPCFDSDDNSTEDSPLPVFSIRREMAIPVRLGDKDWSYINYNGASSSEPTPLAAISLSLVQPSYRLPFVYRLIKSIKNRDDWSDDEGKYLESIGKYFAIGSSHSQEDCAFLTDGRGDLLIVFMSPDSVGSSVKPSAILNRIDDIFKIQDALYQDFMVDRTRLFFMPESLKIFSAEDCKDKYSAKVRFRLVEDRTLDLSNHTAGLLAIDGLYKSPGQYDYEINLDSYLSAKPDEINLLDYLNNILQLDYIDHTETIILKKWEQ